MKVGEALTKANMAGWTLPKNLIVDNITPNNNKTKNKKVL